MRLVSGCIPYKFEKSVGGCNRSMEKELLVLMISSPSRDDLVFPKGGWEDDETMSEAARREAWEEAGVKGVLGVGFSALLGNRKLHWEIGSSEARANRIAAASKEVVEVSCLQWR